MKEFLKDRLTQILWLGDDALVELILAVNTLLWGLWILWPVDILQAKVFSYMLSAMPELVWGWIFTVVGFTKLCSVVINKRPIRMWVTVFACGFWTWIAVLLFKGSHYALIPSSVIIWSVVNALLFFRHRFKKEEDRQHAIIEREDIINIHEANVRQQ